MKKIFVIGVLFLSIHSFGQKAGHSKPNVPVDTSYTDYDALFNELDELFDSITKPRSFAVVNVSAGNTAFDFYNSSGDSLNSVNKLILSPMIGYFHRSGLGVSAGASVINDGQSFNPYQVSLTGGYDYLQNRRFLTGVSFTHYFTKRDLSFYTSPLQNESQVYFTYRESNFRPSVNLRYGWGSEQTTDVQQVQKNKNKTTTTNITTQQHVGAVNLTTSLRYDFYWLDNFSAKDYIRLSPQISFTSGSQQYAFNQESNITMARGRLGKNISSYTETTASSASSKFQPLSLVTYLKTEYSRGRFFLQPQLAVDYYFPADNNNVSVSFLLNTGFILL